MNVSLPRSLHTKPLFDPCPARWQGVACARQVGHAGPHESVASAGGCMLSWRSAPLISPAIDK
jgi:hypothetical protein